MPCYALLNCQFAMLLLPNDGRVWLHVGEAICGRGKAMLSSKSSEPRMQAVMVRSGEDRLDQAMDIAGWRFECKLSGRDTGGDCCVFDTVRSVKGGPPLHMHREQDEWFYVRGGKFLFRVGHETFRLKPGDSLFGPRGVPHAFAALTDASAVIVAFLPAGAIEELFAAAWALSKSRKLGVDDWRAIAAPRGVEIIGPPLQVD
jgi:quercetin dioxygenase-like cupin family protein